jgi:uncharacterized protein YceH (UPF0502 family)
MSEIPQAAPPDATATDQASPRRWQPLGPRQRRVLGVLIEKAKTTPDAYPMTVNALVAGCNQKSNRDPLMNLSAEDVEQVLEELRALGVVTEVQGSGRVPKYRHHAYDWLGVDKVELAVMAELLLRGEQTLGELRSRASRMEPIPDLAAMKEVASRLASKGLLWELTPPGRGQVVSHALYKEREVAELKARYAGHVPAAGDEEPIDPLPGTASGDAAPRPVAAGGGVTADQWAELEVEVAQLRADVATLREQVAQLAARLDALLH